MLIKDLLPFSSTLRLAGIEVGDPDQVSLRSLRDAVQGKFGESSRSQAMAQLIESDFPNKARELQHVLEDPDDTLEARYMAAIHLGMINSAEALKILIDNTKLPDDYLVSGVLLSLRRIGDDAALAAVAHLQQGRSKTVQHQASMTAAFIAHRLGLPGHEWQAPPQEAQISDPLSSSFCNHRNLRLSTAHSVDAEICLRSLARRPYAVELLEKPMLELRCGHQIWMIVFTRIFIESDLIDSLLRRCSLLAIIARRDPISHLHHAAYLLFTSPDSSEGKSGAALHLCRADGDLIARGQLITQGQCSEFSLASTGDLQQLHLEIEGSVSPAQLTFVNAFTVRRAKRRPVNEVRKSVKA